MLVFALRGRLVSLPVSSETVRSNQCSVSHTHSLRRTVSQLFIHWKLNWFVKHEWNDWSETMNRWSVEGIAMCALPVRTLPLCWNSGRLSENIKSEIQIHVKNNKNNIQINYGKIRLDKSVNQSLILLSSRFLIKLNSNTKEPKIDYG